MKKSTKIILWGLGIAVVGTTVYFMMQPSAISKVVNSIKTGGSTVNPNLSHDYQELAGEKG